MSIEEELAEKVKEFRGKPFFKAVLKEWVLHVNAAQDPEVFANMYLEWMRDPEDHEAREMVSIFVNFMKVSNWDDVLAMIEPVLEEEDLEVFRRPIAREFYAAWSRMVIYQVRAYWEKFIQSRTKNRPAQVGAVPPKDRRTTDGPELEIGTVYKVELAGGAWFGEFMSRLAAIAREETPDGVTTWLTFRNGIRMTLNWRCTFTKAADETEGTGTPAP